MNKPEESPVFKRRHSQWLKGILDLAVLGLIGDDTKYGYELANQLTEAGLGEVTGGTLYPRLRAIESEGLLVSEWRAGDGGPGRKYYKVTDAGRAALAFHGPDWLDFAQAATKLISEAARSNHQPPPPLVVELSDRTLVRTESEE